MTYEHISYYEMFLVACVYHCLCLSLPVSILACVYHRLCLSSPVSIIACVYHCLCLSSPVSIIACVYHRLCLSSPVSIIACVMCQGWRGVSGRAGIRPWSCPRPPSTWTAHTLLRASRYTRWECEIILIWWKINYVFCG